MRRLGSIRDGSSTSALGQAKSKLDEAFVDRPFGPLPAVSRPSLGRSSISILAPSASENDPSETSDGQSTLPSRKRVRAQVEPDYLESQVMDIDCDDHTLDPDVAVKRHKLEHVRTKDAALLTVKSDIAHNKEEGLGGKCGCFIVVHYENNSDDFAYLSASRCFESISNKQIKSKTGGRCAAYVDLFNKGMEKLQTSFRFGRVRLSIEEAHELGFNCVKAYPGEEEDSDLDDMQSASF